MFSSLSFHTTLLPQTPETTQHVLTQGGYASLTHSQPPQSSEKDPFSVLLEETRAIICSADFSCVLEACLDRATEVLLSSVESAVFANSTEATVPGEEVRIRLAGLLPGLARWSHLALNGLPNELIDVGFPSLSSALVVRLMFFSVLCRISWMYGRSPP
jgi:peroxin-3